MLQLCKLNVANFVLSEEQQAGTVCHTGVLPPGGDNYIIITSVEIPINSLSRDFLSVNKQTQCA